MHLGPFLVLFCTLAKASLGKKCDGDDDSTIWRINLGGDIVDYNSCAELIAAHKFYCKAGEKIGPHVIRERCCHSCRNIPDDVCADEPQLIDAPDGEYLCPELVQLYPAYCDPEYSYNELEVCCESCKGVNVKCYDNDLVSYYSITAVDRSVTYYGNCAEYIAAHPWYCRNEASIRVNGKDVSTRESCCQSCKGISGNVCANEPGMIVYIENYSFMCDALPEAWCDYKDYRQRCCKRCKELAEQKEEGCIDGEHLFPVYIDPQLTVKDFQCAELIANYEFYCRSDAFIYINSKKYFTREVCCESCKNIDENICADEPQSIEVSNQGDFDCTGLVKLNPDVCDPTKPSIAKDYPRTCCKSCQSVNFDCMDRPLNGFQLWISATEKKTYDDCASLVADYLWFCRSDSYFRFNGKEVSTRDHCCVSCSSVSENMCLDKPIRVHHKGAFRTCPELVAATPELCDANLPESRDVPTECCVSCQSVDLSCYDRTGLTVRLWELISGRQKKVKYTSCEAIVAKHPFFCRSDSFMELDGKNVSTRNLCCASCSKIDADICADDNGGLHIFKPPQARRPKQYLCSQLVAEFPAACDPNDRAYRAQECCKACQGVDISCVDSTKEFSFQIGRRNLRLQDKSCATIISKFPGLCLYGADDHPLGKKDQCCASCSNQDLSCVDDPFVYENFGTETKPVFKFCHELGRPSSSSWRKNCCPDGVGSYQQGYDKDGNRVDLKDACCATCSAASC